MSACPNCGDDIDALAAPGKSNTIEEYAGLCVIGSGSPSALAGYRVIHQ